MLKVAIDVVLEDGQFSHGQNIEGLKSEILEKIGEEIGDGTISITIKKRPMQNALTGTVNTTERFSNH